MDVAGILGRLKTHGITLSVSEDRLRLVPGSRVPPELVEILRENKSQIIAYLAIPKVDAAEVAEDVDACLRLAQRLRKGELNAIRCGLTGKECRLCKGVPCLGSTPLEEGKSK